MRGPCATIVQVDLLRILTDMLSNMKSSLEQEASELTEMRRTVALGMYSVSCKMMSAPPFTCSWMFPIPIAATLEPPSPFTFCGGIGLKDLKSLRYGEMWTVAPESIRKGVDSIDVMRVCPVCADGEMFVASTSSVAINPTCSHCSILLSGE